jgi:hypothetical protein
MPNFREGVVWGRGRGISGKIEKERVLEKVKYQLAHV